MDRIGSMTDEQVKAFYDSVFQTATADIAVVGDFDPKEVKAAIADSFTKKSETPFVRVDSEYRPVAPKRIVIDTAERERLPDGAPRFRGEHG